MPNETPAPRLACGHPAAGWIEHYDWGCCGRCAQQAEAALAGAGRAGGGAGGRRPLRCASCGHAERQHRTDGYRACEQAGCACPGMRCPHPTIRLDGEGAWCTACLLELAGEEDA